MRPCTWLARTSSGDVVELKNEATLPELRCARSGLPGNQRRKLDRSFSAILSVKSTEQRSRQVPLASASHDRHDAFAFHLWQKIKQDEIIKQI